MLPAKNHRPRRVVHAVPVSRATASGQTPRLLPLGALAAGFGLIGADALAQSAPSAPPAPAPSASAARETTLKPISVKAKIETDKDSVRATTTTIGKGLQELRDIPQSVTIVTEKLIQDRHIDTVKEALHQTAGITFQAAEGGEEDIRLRGFSLTASGDIYIDGMRDPAFYDRDTFSYDRIELLRGSASMLFGPRLDRRGRQPGEQGAVPQQRERGRPHGRQPFLRPLHRRLQHQARRDVGAAHRGDEDQRRQQRRRREHQQGRHRADGAIRHRHARRVPGRPLLPRQPQRHQLRYPVPAPQQRPAGLGGQPGRADREPRSDRQLRPVERLQQQQRHLRHVQPRAPVPGRRLAEDGGAQRHLSARPALRRHPLRQPGAGQRRPDLPHRRDRADARHAEQGAGHGRHVHPVRLQQPLQLVRHEQRGADRHRPDAREVRQLHPRAAARGDAGEAADDDRRGRKRLGRRRRVAAPEGAQPQLRREGGRRLRAGPGPDHPDLEAARRAALGPLRGRLQEPDERDLPEASRADNLFSHRFGVLYQPTDAMTFYASHGTSFNTAGELYNYDAPGSKTPPEKSRNIEIGGKVDLFEGRMSTRLAAFHSTKYNERNRDSPAGTPIDDYLLSGKRHAVGMELDLSGRITSDWEVFGSYAWIPSARIDVGNPDGSTLTGERVGDRPSLTPKQSGTIWTTYQITPQWRVGGGLNARSSQTPNRNPVGIVAPSYVTGDLLAEFTLNDAISFKLNVNNVTNKLVADSLYTAHYVPGPGRMVFLSMTTRF